MKIEINYLIPIHGVNDDREGDGNADHSMGRRHAVFQSPLLLEAEHGRARGPRPTHYVLDTLSLITSTKSCLRRNNICCVIMFHSDSKYSISFMLPESRTVFSLLLYNMTLLAFFTLLLHLTENPSCEKLLVKCKIWLINNNF